MNNIMLDLEMLGIGPEGFICAIGAVAFDANAIGLPFYATVTSQVGNGTIDAETVFWWMKQSAEARAEFERTEVRFHSLSNLLIEFAVWVEDIGAQFLWANGSAEDNALSDAAWQAKHLINMNARVGGLIL